MGELEVHSVQTYFDDLSIRFSDSTMNRNAKYKGEPIVKTLIFHRDSLSAKTIVKPDGPEKFEFKTLNEAKEYFAREYGIEAEFMNLKQAFLTKEAVDEFVKLNYKGLGKKLFEGLRITYGPLGNHNTTAIHCLNVSLSNSCNIPEPNVGSLDECRDFIKKLDDSDFTVNCRKIILNSELDWDALEKTSKKCKDSNYHPYAECKYAIAHELVHNLHSRNIPTKQYWITDAFENENEKKIAEEAGGYATKSPLEFVAEYAIGKMTRLTFSKEADELYKKYGGPDLWGNFKTTPEVKS